MCARRKVNEATFRALRITFQTLRTPSEPSLKLFLIPFHFNHLKTATLKEILVDSGVGGKYLFQSFVPPPDKLGKELGISVNLCRKGKIPVSEFCNKDLSDIVNEEKEFEYFTKIRDAQEITRFSFLRYEFILTTATKVQALSFDSEVRMGNEQRSTYVRRVVFPDEETNPYCHFTVRRDHLVDDALKIIMK
ncbi:ubiquitin-protein ligase E3A-like [Artemia franciscana]|uniref:ubiquitin-protein ligase E3A-like n=1 Tax=Artemia franciscana TaxID=6661 RepID=UPI0032DBE615